MTFEQTFLPSFKKTENGAAFNLMNDLFVGRKIHISSFNLLHVFINKWIKQNYKIISKNSIVGTFGSTKLCMKFVARIFSRDSFDTC